MSAKYFQIVYPNNPNNQEYWNKYGGLSQITPKGISKSIEYGLVKNYSLSLNLI